MIEITPHPRQNVRCDIAGCKYPIDPLWVNEKGSPTPLRLICCKTHLKEIILAGIEMFGDELKIASLNTGNKEVDELRLQLESQTAAMEVLKEKIVELERKLATSQKQLKPANTAKKGRGKR
jgi:hypothetical protein